MAITPINITRVTHNMRSMSLRESLRRNSLNVFQQQNRLATGRAFNAASEDPVAASKALKLNQLLSRQEQILENLRHADLMLAASDNALAEVNNLLIEAESLASRSVGSLIDSDERVANAELVAAVRDQLMVVGNRAINGSFLFAGRDTQSAPFESAPGGIAFTGDSGDVLTRVSDFEQERINLPGDVLFGAVSGSVGAASELRPALTADTRLEDLAGANALGIRKGTIIISDGVSPIEVDLRTADTVGDVVDMINAAAEDAGVTLSVAIQGDGLVVSGTGVNITDTDTGVMASDLGLLSGEAGSFQSSSVTDLRTRVTPNTPIEALNGGNGIALTEGIRITNGPLSAVIDLSEVTTVQGVLNAVNGAGLGALARINAEGTGIEIVNRVSGSVMSISENGGTTATELGIRSFNLSTRLSELNFGRGVEVLTGEADLTITAKDGTSFDVNLDGAATIGDVIDLINTAAEGAGVTVAASLGSTSNGIVLTDSTGGAGSLSVSRASIDAFAGDDLALIKSVNDPATVLVGDDVNQARPDGVFSALFDLERALRNGDERLITDAAERLTEFSMDVTRAHGVIGARAQAMRARLDQTESAVNTTRSFLSEIEDLDYTEAVTRFQQAQTALQASLLSGSQLLNVSLLNFLA
ncbi:MAG: hypothetical protein IID39_01685 [Planctomycetes bacterium]|nr:hypothetical protein [Planctomycetota bacterium]